MAEKVWKSPRKVAEEVRAYKHKRFEDYMLMEDDGLLERDVAISALRNEIEASHEIWTPESSDA